jgi:hypothetical protein
MNVPTLNHLSSETLLFPDDAVLTNTLNFTPGHGGRRTATSGPVTGRSYGSEGHGMENYTAEPYTKLFMPRLHSSAHHRISWTDNTRRNPDTQSVYSGAPPRKRPPLNSIRPVSLGMRGAQTVVGNTDQHAPYSSIHHSHMVHGGSDRVSQATTVMAAGGDAPAETTGASLEHNGISASTSAGGTSVPDTGVLARTAKQHFMQSAMESASLGK